MPIATIRSLVVRPFFSMDLCFPHAGIIRSRATHANLGTAEMPGFDLNSLILDHMDKKKDQGPATRFIYDSKTLREFLQPKALYMLRNDRQAADLDTAIHRRNIAFLEKYAHIAGLADTDPAAVDSWPARHALKLEHLRQLQLHAITRHTSVVTLAEADEETGARAPETDSFYYDGFTYPSTPGPTMPSPKPNHVRTVAETESLPVGMFHSGTIMKVTNEQRSQNTGGAAGLGESLHTNTTLPSFTFPTGVSENYGLPIPLPMFSRFNSQTTRTENYTHRSRRLDGDYRNPHEEEWTRYEREMVSLEQELVDVYTYNRRLPHLQEIWEAELGEIEADVRRAQLAYVDTFLIPPPTEPQHVNVQVPETPATREVTGGVSGVIMAINKDAGEYVQAGEPVLRIENAGRALLAGLLVYRGRLATSQQVTLDFRGLFEEPAPQAGRFPGTIVTIRGHDSDNDLWDVVIECSNWDVSLLPINYTFESTPDRYGVPGSELQGAVVEV